MDKINESIFNANVKLVDDNKFLKQEVKELNNKIEKAVNYILDKSVEYKPNFRKVNLNTKDCNELLDILGCEIYE